MPTVIGNYPDISAAADAFKDFTDRLRGMGTKIPDDVDARFNMAMAQPEGPKREAALRRLRDELLGSAQATAAKRYAGAAKVSPETAENQIFECEAYFSFAGGELSETPAGNGLSPLIPKAPATGRQPHTMTQARFLLACTALDRNCDSGELKRIHEESCRKAIEEGKDVSPEVIAPYPELRARRVSQALARAQESDPRQTLDR